MNVNDFLSGMDAGSKRRLSSVMNTPSGQMLMEKLKTMDKDELLRQFSAMNSAGMPNADALKQIANDPQLVSKLNQFLNGGGR